MSIFSLLNILLIDVVILDIPNFILLIISGSNFNFSNTKLIPSKVKLYNLISLSFNPISVSDIVSHTLDIPLPILETILDIPSLIGVISKSNPNLDIVDWKNPNTPSNKPLTLVIENENPLGLSHQFLILTENPSNIFGILTAKSGIPITIFFLRISLISINTDKDFWNILRGTIVPRTSGSNNSASFSPTIYACLALSILAPVAAFFNGWTSPPHALGIGSENKPAFCPDE